MRKVESGEEEGGGGGVFGGAAGAKQGLVLEHVCNCFQR